MAARLAVVAVADTKELLSVTRKAAAIVFMSVALLKVSKRKMFARHSAKSEQ